MNYMLRVPPIPIRWDSRERCQTVRVCHTPQQGTQRTLTRPSRGVERIPDDIHAAHRLTRTTADAVTTRVAPAQRPREDHAHPELVSITDTVFERVLMT